MSFRFRHHTLFFHKPAKTSRNVLRERDVYYLTVNSTDQSVTGIGECAPIWGLSPETKPAIERTISHWDTIVEDSDQLTTSLSRYSSLRFALETAMRDLAAGGEMNPFEVETKTPIPINGLIWMSDARTMLEECRAKVESGFSTIKFKVGALNFDEELELLKKVRSEFGNRDIEIRLDANGAFSKQDALEKLDALARFTIHSIEQPIQAGNAEAMAHLVEKAPMPIALDEELIGVHDAARKAELLNAIQPHFIILKPTLHGAFTGCDEWVKLAEDRSIGWWATSALESNIGLNAIAQWVLTKNNPLPQGLGTGGLFTNNIASPWVVQGGFLKYDRDLQWNLKPILP
jgi:o-succinylbenzoate synthase